MQSQILMITLINQKVLSHLCPRSKAGPLGVFLIQQLENLKLLCKENHGNLFLKTGLFIQLALLSVHHVMYTKQC